MYNLTSERDPGLGALDSSRRIDDVVLPFEDAVIARELGRMPELRQIQKAIWLGATLRHQDDYDDGA